VLSGRGERGTPLSLSVYIGLSLGSSHNVPAADCARVDIVCVTGAILAGHVSLAVEFRMKAREELSYLFDEPEYAVAQVRAGSNTGSSFAGQS
jgi:hypothetical protein